MKTASAILVISINLYIVVHTTDSHEVTKHRIKDSGNFYWLKDEPCSQKIMRSQMIKVANYCIPRETIVDVAPDDANGGIYLPQHVLIKRCGGGVAGKTTSCMPTKTKNVNVYLEYTNNLMEKSCYLTQAVEHLECKLGCIIKNKDCTTLQTFHESTCKCACNNQMEEALCRKRMDAMWDDHNCKCKCNTEEDCSTGFIFSINKCACVPHMRFRGKILYKSLKQRRKGRSG